VRRWKEVQTPRGQELQGSKDQLDPTNCRWGQVSTRLKYGAPHLLPALELSAEPDRPLGIHSAREHYGHAIGERLRVEKSLSFATSASDKMSSDFIIKLPSQRSLSPEVKAPDELEFRWPLKHRWGSEQLRLPPSRLAAGKQFYNQQHNQLDQLIRGGKRKALSVPAMPS